MGNPACSSRRATRSEDVDPRNRLNDLTNRQWLIATKSVWYSRPAARDDLKREHPATFAEEDAEQFIRLFTKSGERVLDPFVGTGSTVLACLASGRQCIGIELSEKWADTARRRCARVHPSLPLDDGHEHEDTGYEILRGDSRTELFRFKDQSFDFILTSPPYWNILDKEGAKVMAERAQLAKNYEGGYERRATSANEGKRQKAKSRSSLLAARSAQLAAISDYEVFRENLKIVWRECFRVLKLGKYAVVIVTDFRHGPRYFLYHADIARDLEDCGFALKGTIILVQDNKNLYAYGIPFAFVPNVHHQIALVLAKDAVDRRQ